VGPDDYVFTNAKNGGPINQSEWPKDHWHAALRATGIRPRKFYATRHTFISIALTRGVNIKCLAEYTGTSVAMIERGYGRFLAESGESQLDLLGDDGDTGGHHQRRQDRTRKTRDLGGRVSVLRRKTQTG
jgi:integrase